MYLNYKQLSLEVEETDGTFAARLAGDGEAEQPRIFLDRTRFAVCRDGRRFVVSDYARHQSAITYGIDFVTGEIQYAGGPAGAPDFALRFRLADRELTVATMIRGTLELEAEIIWGDDPVNATFAVRRQGEDGVLRSGCGPAAGADDDALFDRLTDRLLAFETAGQFELGFDWERRAYQLRYANGEDWGRELVIRIHPDYCRRSFNIPYAPIRKDHGFATPPVGWMSWYALQFTTCQAKVLANAGVLAREFAPYSKQLCCWVDWEWLHGSFEDGEDGVDSFSPRPAPYPDGLAPMATAIRKLGVIPALWAGPTNEWKPGRLYAEHPDWLLGEHKAWCGRYWLDLSNPDVVEQFIPAVFRQMLDWGFRVVKWDCLPMTLQVGDLFHQRCRDRGLSTEAALRAVIAAGRRALGPEVYMLSCSGETERDITLAMDIFDAARIGGDVFGWDHFIAAALGRVYRFFCWHNVVFYADADNLVLREEFNTMAQARSRVSFYGLTGLPVTIGDDLTKLPAERIDLLKTIVPTVDIHPRDLRRRRCGEATSLVSLAINRPFRCWQVAGLLNLSSEAQTITLDLRRDLGLRPGRKYALYEFWTRRFLGIFSHQAALAVGAHDTALLRITEINDRPELVFSSRHLTQGAVEFETLAWSAADKCWRSRSHCVPNREWELAFYLPSGWRFAAADSSICSETEVKDQVLHLRLRPGEAEVCDWSIRFESD